MQDVEKSECSAPLGATIRQLEILVFRVPLDTPRINSFGAMTHRTALVVRLKDEDGYEGWGECFCNWPAFAAEHRYRILTDLVAPRLAGHRFEAPQDVQNFLNQEFRILRIQADEPGPFDQSIAAVDIAAWDLAARRAEKPLYQVLGAKDVVENVPYYASGLSPDQASRVAERELEIGTNAFKCKVGWGLQNDLKTLQELREVIGNDATLMVDANQKWDVDTAREMIRAFEPFNLDWVEEPIPADHKPDDFAELARIGIQIAAGENIRGHSNFSEMMSSGSLSVVQPDIIKWGGITACFKIAQSALEKGLRFCPHYLGGGIGLIASAHLLAAAGGDGLLELDATPNSLRTLLASPFPELKGGNFPIPQGPGLGLVADLNGLENYRCNL